MLEKDRHAACASPVLLAGFRRHSGKKIAWDGKYISHFSRTEVLPEQVSISKKPRIRITFEGMKNIFIYLAEFFKLGIKFAYNHKQIDNIFFAK